MHLGGVEVAERALERRPGQTPPRPHEPAAVAVGGRFPDDAQVSFDRPEHVPRGPAVIAMRGDP
jgi:hypothetical protein